MAPPRPVSVSASIRQRCFGPVEKLKEEGYTEYTLAVSATAATAHMGAEQPQVKK